MDRPLQTPRVMKRRLVLGVAVAGVILGAAYWFLPRSGAAPTTAGRTGKIDVRKVKQGPAEPPAADKPKMVMTESGWRPQTTRKTPRTWVDPVSGAINREILDAVPDPEAAARHELNYRKSRLRLMLSDAAAPCWTGGDSQEEIELEYTLIVENEVVRTDNVRVVQSRITNPSVERCIIDAVRDLRTPATRLPNLREDQGLIMSLHDLHDRHEREIRNSAKPDDKPGPYDRPTPGATSP